jgi:hypothetical protein
MSEVKQTDSLVYVSVIGKQLVEIVQNLFGAGVAVAAAT